MKKIDEKIAFVERLKVTSKKLTIFMLVSIVIFSSQAHSTSQQNRSSHMQNPTANRYTSM